MDQILILGIDGGTWDILDKYIRLGDMPQLAKITRLNRGILSSTQPPITPAAWSSFHTGKNPGVHGVIDFIVRDPLTHQIDVVDSAFLGTNTIWHQLAKKHLTSAVFNVPMTYPPQNLPGLVASGILTPDPDSPWTYPHQLKSQILKDLPDYQPVSLKIPSAAQVHQHPQQFLNFVSDALKQRTNLGLWCIQSHPVSVMMIQFQVIDWLQHSMWPYLSAPKPKASVRKVFKQLDEHISSLWQAWQDAHPSPQILILSDHGFQAHKARVLLGNYFYVNGILDKRGGTKQKINHLIKPTGLEIKDNSPFDLLGRSSWGQVYTNPGHDNRQVYKLLKTICAKLVDPATHQPVIKKVWSKHELYSGPKVKQLPDYLIEPINGYTITAAIDKSGQLFQPIIPGKDFHLGIHHMNGIITTSIATPLPKRIDQVAKYIVSHATK